ncbi:DUF6302 family protein [Streptomyces sp. DT195]|uniref:DUF6302 family protein n=1 Tax=Streptomyces sp. DT195 TaxID=3393419 RepID=UPI003CEFD928
MADSDISCPSGPGARVRLPDGRHPADEADLYAEANRLGGFIPFMPAPREGRSNNAVGVMVHPDLFHVEHRGTSTAGLSPTATRSGCAWTTTPSSAFSATRSPRRRDRNVHDARPAPRMLSFLLARTAAPLCRPSPGECREEYTWFQERLAHPDLLDAAVGVKVGSAVLLAVPAGRCRSGGYMSVGTAADAVRVWAALRGQPGFPRARIGLSFRRDTRHTVIWGPRPPWDDAERGRYFGFTQPAISTFLRRDSVLDQQTGPEKYELVERGRRATWQRDPLLSTLRDVGGCLAVILCAVLVTLLVSTARATWPLLGGISASPVKDKG